MKQRGAIFLEDPNPFVPRPAHRRGKAPTRYRTHATPVRVVDWVKEQPPENWRRIPIRQSTKGMLSADFLKHRVWLWDGQEGKAHCWHLIVRREIASPGKIKYSLSNASEETSLERLAFMQGQRFWIERAFQNAKSASGIADYQARSWTSWHHHSASVDLW